jgi:GNAT superfamily N-acetyltransferase
VTHAARLREARDGAPRGPRRRSGVDHLCDGYNAFYGRAGPTALSPAIVESTWRRFLDPGEPVHALVAERDGELVGLAHFIFHRSTILLGDTCYLQDLFTAPVARGTGIGRALIEETAARARGRRVRAAALPQNRPREISPRRRRSDETTGIPAASGLAAPHPASVS